LREAQGGNGIENLASQFGLGREDTEKVLQQVLPNFHLPRSTLMMLISALMGVDEVKTLYSHAISSGYRFYSYGDGSLLLPA